MFPTLALHFALIATSNTEEFLRKQLDELMKKILAQLVKSDEHSEGKNGIANMTDFEISSRGLKY
jgi:hypothetical protein